jgi:hypothetical protein
VLIFPLIEIKNDVNELLREIDKLDQYLIYRNWPVDELELFYEFCHTIITKLQNYEYDFQFAYNQIESAFRIMVYGE